MRMTLLHAVSVLAIGLLPMPRPSFGADLPQHKGSILAFAVMSDTPPRQYCRSPFPDALRLLSWPCDPQEFADTSDRSVAHARASAKQREEHAR